MAPRSDDRTPAAGTDLDAVLDPHGLDALIAPAGGPPWPTDLVNGDHFLGGGSFSAIAGHPVREDLALRRPHGL